MGKCGIGVKIGDDMNRQLLHRLGGIFDTHQILASDLYREIYSRDGSYFDIKPEVIVRPDTPQQVQQLLAIASVPEGLRCRDRVLMKGLSVNCVRPGRKARYVIMDGKSGLSRG